MSSLSDFKSCDSVRNWLPPSGPLYWTGAQLLAAVDTGTHGRKAGYLDSKTGEADAGELGAGLSSKTKNIS